MVPNCVLHVYEPQVVVYSHTKDTLLELPRVHAADLSADLDSTFKCQNYVVLNIGFKFPLHRLNICGTM